MYVMPTLPISMASGIKKTPVFNTTRQKSAAGITSAIALQPYPTWQYEVSLDHVQGNESKASSIAAQFLGAFMATQGGANLFLFADPQSNSVTNAQFGTGDGVTTSFQLSRNIAGSVDIIQNLNGSPSIYVNGVHNISCSISSTGVVSFPTSPPAAPASGAVLTWSGYFYYACRFTDDTIDAIREFTINSGVDHWSFSGIKFTSEFIPGATYGAIAASGGF